MTIETTGTAPLQVGQSRSFSAGPTHLLTVSRTTAGYVVTATRDGVDLPCYTSVFGVDNVPVDMTPRRAAFVYMAGLYDTFIDLPAPVAPAAPVELPAGQKRTASSTTLSDPLFAVLQAMNVNGGSISPRAGCSVTQLRALRDKGLADLEYAPGTTRIRRAYLTGAGRVRLNSETAARRTARTQTLAA